MMIQWVIYYVFVHSNVSLRCKIADISVQVKSIYLLTVSNLIHTCLHMVELYFKNLIILFPNSFNTESSFFLND